jgi:hypothetical protein
MRVGLGERPTSEPDGDDRGEVRALQDVVVGAAQRVVNGLTGGLGLDDLLIELSEFALREPPPIASRTGALRHEGLLLAEGESGLA